MIALVDCNSFFCSVEKVFHPGLEGKPVCVLSNNDGCIVALTPEAKAVGLHRGDPIFKVQDIVNRYGVRIFSTNMYLYASMSKRVKNILRKSVKQVENYSIDESFCYLDGYEQYYDIVEFMRGVAQKVRLCTDIPVSVGIAPSKTLAKMGSKFAKQYKGYNGVCLIDTEEKRRGQGSVCGTVTVFVSSNRFREDLQQYGNASSFSFITPTSDTMEITQAALKCLDAIYVPGIMYKKSGVIVGNITPSNPIQLDLFDTNPKRKERNDLMRAMDDINHRYGVKTLHLVVEGFPSPANGGTEGGVKTIEEHQQWHVKCEHRSPRSAFAACKSKNYLTNINEILTIKI